MPVNHHFIKKNIIRKNNESETKIYLMVQNLIITDIGLVMYYHAKEMSKCFTLNIMNYFCYVAACTFMQLKNP